MTLQLVQFVVEDSGVRSLAAKSSSSYSGLSANFNKLKALALELGVC